MAISGLAGIAFLSINGRAYRVVGELQYQPSTVKKEPLNGQDGYHGPKVTAINGWIKAKLRDAGDLKVADINALSGATVVAELINGKTVIGRNLEGSAAEGVDTAEGSFDAEFFGADVSEN